MGGEFKMVVRMTRFAIGLLMALISAAAAGSPIHVFVVVVDWPENEEGRVRGAEAPAALGEKLLSLIEDVDTRGATPEAELNPNLGAECVRAVGVNTSGALRWFGSRGDVLFVITKDPKVSARIPALTEERRESRFSTDLNTLARIVKQLMSGGVTTRDLTPSPYHFRAIRLAEHRAYVNYVISRKAEGNDSKELTGRVVTGPSEHFFIAGGYVVQRLQEVKYNETTKAIESKEAPQALFALPAYTVGDLQSALGGGSAVEGLFVGGLIKVSKSPLDSVGVAVGYRFPAVRAAGIELQALAPFVGVLWTKEDRVGANGQPDRDAVYGPRLRFGLSVDLTMILGWLTPGKGSGKP